MNSPSTTVQRHSALRLEWHWNGTVDGSNDLINDQIGYSQTTGSVAPQQGANRGPTVANPIYVNTNVFSGTGGSGALNLAPALNGFTVSNNTGLGTYNTYSSANYDQAGNNLLGGTNRVQFSFSDYKTIDYSRAGNRIGLCRAGIARLRQWKPGRPRSFQQLVGDRCEQRARSLSVRVDHQHADQQHQSQHGL